jgi:hypothetical protein
MRYRLPLILVAIGLAAPLAAQDRDGLDWSLRGEGDSRTLAFELPDTDLLHLGLSCERGSGQVTLWRAPPADTRPEFRLSSGQLAATLPATLDTEDLPYLSTTVPTRDPVLQRFRTTGELTLTADGTAKQMDATGPQRERIASFFRHCG